MNAILGTSRHPPTVVERANVSTVCRHLALVAIDGATDEVALTWMTTDWHVWRDWLLQHTMT